MRTISPQRSRRIRGLIAGLAGGALLLAGGTFALWSDSATIDEAGRVKMGTLDLTVDGPHGFDVSSSGVDWTSNDPRWDQDQKIEDMGFAQGCLPPSSARTTWGHVIVDGRTWEASPGDKLQVIYPARVDLSGDNMVAKLTAKIPADSITGLVQSPGFLIDNGVNPHYADQDALQIEVFVNGDPVPVNASGTPFGAGDVATWEDLVDALQTIVDVDGNITVVSEYFQPTDATNQASGLPEFPLPRPGMILDADADGAGFNVCAVLTLRVPDFQNQDATQVDGMRWADRLLVRLRDITWSLDQVRNAIGSFR
jgi:predicted ribosomally synthesized peptide with SipW-like signal peptide